MSFAWISLTLLDEKSLWFCQQPSSVRLGGQEEAPWGPGELSPHILAESMGWASLQTGWLWLPAALPCLVRACACKALLGVSRDGVRAARVPAGVRAVAVPAPAWPTADGRCCARRKGCSPSAVGGVGWPWPLVGFLLKSLSEQSGVSTWLPGEGE